MIRGSVSIAVHRTCLLLPLIQLVVQEGFIAFRSLENFTFSSHVRSALRAKKESIWGCRWLMFQHGIADWILITFYTGLHSTAEHSHRICKFAHIALYINNLHGFFLVTWLLAIERTTPLLRSDQWHRPHCKSQSRVTNDCARCSVWDRSKFVTFYFLKSGMALWQTQHLVSWERQRHYFHFVLRVRMSGTVPPFTDMPSSYALGQHLTFHQITVAVRRINNQSYCRKHTNQSGNSTDRR